MAIVLGHSVADDDDFVIEPENPMKHMHEEIYLVNDGTHPGELVRLGFGKGESTTTYVREDVANQRINDALDAYTAGLEKIFDEDDDLVVT